MKSNAYGVRWSLLKGGNLGNLKRLAMAGLFTIASATSLAAQPLTLLALGDSLTAGYGLAQGDGFVPQLERWLSDHGADIHIINAGVSGDTTAGGRARLGWSLSEEVDAVLVNLGGNDMLRGLPPEETRRNLDAILAELSARQLPTALIRVPGSLNFGATDKAAYDAAFADLATQYGALFIPDYFAALRGHEQEGSDAAMQTYMQADGLHPTKAGVALIVDEIGPLLLDWLTAKRALSAR